MLGFGSNPAVAAPVQKAAVAAPQPLKMDIPDVEIPMNSDPKHPDNKSPMGVMGRFLKMFMANFKQSLQTEFDANATRANTPEDDMNPEKSKSMLPTLGRALKSSLPMFIGGLMTVLGDLIASLLSLFKVSKSTQDMVKGAIKTMGKGMFSGQPGAGLESMVTTAAPALVKGLTDFLGVNVTPEAMEAAAAFPKSATFTPAASTTLSTVAQPFTQDEINQAYGVTEEEIEQDQDMGFFGNLFRGPFSRPNF